MAIVPAVGKRRLLNLALSGTSVSIHLVAFAVQPGRYVKRMSINRAMLRPGIAWKILAVFAHSPATVKRIFGKSTETLDISRLGPDRFMHVTTAKPMTRRRRRKMRKRGVDVPTLKDQKAYGRLWAAKADAAKRAS